MVSQIHELVRKTLKMLYPWIKLDIRDWPELIAKIKKYRPKIYVHSVVWKPPVAQRLKFNTDGASRGNPGMSSFGFCIRDGRGDLRYAKAKGIGIITNTEAEALAIYKALEYNYDDSKAVEGTLGNSGKGGRDQNESTSARSENHPYL
ncbi:hypothetical protein KY290_007745 [Solanum tuberosum]|uniref:RNase H type-1 domain-containing protein n=1 Tax=Solanum tuberosum TaxID=4113 RepID=A0ABQ7W6K1_SOLTU|nr:hypothetical protein KY290_007745 [Solanum tuberosum]